MYMSPHIAILMPLEISKYENQIHLRRTLLCLCSVFSGRRGDEMTRIRGAYGTKISVHVSSGLKEAATADNREDVIPFCWVLQRGI